jgi:hypothetical protein
LQGGIESGFDPADSVHSPMLLHDV